VPSTKGFPLGQACRELFWAHSVLPMEYADLVVTPSECVSCGDASRDGMMGAVEAEVSVSGTVVAEVCRFEERWRFTEEVCRGWGPRQRVFAEFQDVCEAAFSEPTAKWDPPNLAVPFFDDKLQVISWRTTASRLWQYEERITNLEGRAALWALNKSLSTQGNTKHLHVIIVDNMDLALLLAKGRSSPPTACTIFRRVCANLLGSN
jgi:hypothetical protein